MATDTPIAPNRAGANLSVGPASAACDDLLEDVTQRFATEFITKSRFVRKMVKPAGDARGRRPCTP